MNGIRLVLSMLVCLCAWLGSSPVSAQEDPHYILGSGDLIRILVYGEDDLTMEVLLTDTGTVSYPFLGELQIKGKTVVQVQNTITEGLLGDYLIEPRVNVSILQYRPFFINGEVMRPGGFPYQPGLTIRKAVSLAQGFTERAAKKNIFVISDSSPGEEARRVELNDRVLPGDIITVEQSFF